MSRQVLYVAAPLRPTEEEIAGIPIYNIERGRGEYELDVAIPVTRPEAEARALRANLDRAMRWLAWLRKSFPETTFVAPWIATVMSLGNDDSQKLREAGLIDDCAVVERCDGIVLCGGRISSGMRREMEHGAKAARGPGREVFAVYDMTGDRAYMPSDVELRTDQTWPEWAKALRI